MKNSQEIFAIMNRYGKKIVGISRVPTNTVIGTAVLQHGHGSTKESRTLRALEESLLLTGFRVVRFDATNGVGESDGRYEDARPSLHAEDFGDVVAWVQGQRRWTAGVLLVAGHSMGGFSAIRYAQQHLADVGAVILLAPLVSGKIRLETMEQRNPGILKKWQDVGHIGHISSRSKKPRLKPWDFAVDMEQQDLLPDACKLTMPVLVIAGGLDERISSEHIDVFMNAIPPDNKELYVIRHAGHNFGSYTIELQRAINLWLIKNNL